jgi:glycosyltransferase involved in cell wall biosynthesis
MNAGCVTSIAHVLWSGNVGGIERLVCDLADEQVHGCGFKEVVVAFGRCEGPFIEATENVGARVVDLGLASGYDLRPARLVRGARQLCKADVIHMHAFNPPLAALMHRAKRPIVFTEHGNFALGRSLTWKDSASRALQRRFLRREVVRLAANSRHTAERVRTIYGIEGPDLAVVYNGIRVKGLSKPTLGVTGSSLRLACVGRLVPFKRVDRAVEGLARAHRRRGMSLDIVGGGPMEGQLRSLAASLDVSEQVHFLGYRTDVGEVLDGLDVIVQSSEGEPFGLAMLEACAMGALPIVFADGGGALEILPPDGIVVGDTEELARVLDGLVGSDAFADAARAQRAAWVRERFPISVTASRYLELYRSALTDAKR